MQDQIISSVNVFSPNISTCPLKLFTIQNELWPSKRRMDVSVTAAMPGDLMREGNYSRPGQMEKEHRQGCKTG